LVQIDRMEWLVRNLLLEARMEAGALPLDVAPRLLGTTVTEAVRGFQSRALDLGVTLSLSVPENDVEVPHDRRWLTEAVSNLVKNALDNTPTGGSVAVTVRHTEVFSRIVVVDSGPGIRATDLPHIFDRFYRGRSTAESATSGTGLGLALAKAIVDRHGGVISATSAAAGPASAAPASAAPSPASRATSETAPPAASPGSDTRAPTPASKAAPADAGRAKDRGSGAEFTITLPHLTKL
jgi:signal transduction histidine kinase